MNLTSPQILKPLLPLTNWVILTCAVLILLPLKLPFILWLFFLTVICSLILFLIHRPRHLLIIFPFILTLIASQYLHVPFIASLYPLAKLALVALVWGGILGLLLLPALHVATNSPPQTKKSR